MKRIKCLIACLLILCITLAAFPVTAANAMLTFADVNENSWQYTPVAYVVDCGLMAGKGTDTRGNIIFDPNSPITREEFVQVLYNADGKPTVTLENPYKDVKKTWYTNAVLWAKSVDIANGTPDGSFGIGKNITRQDLAMMLYKYAKLNVLSLYIRADEIGKYADGGLVSAYAKTAMDWAVTNGILSGKGVAGEDISTFHLDPIGTATRAECAAMLKNFMTAFGEILSTCRHRAMEKTEAKEANCTEIGNIAYWYCSACNKYFSDVGGRKQIQYTDTMIRANGHSWTAATCIAAETCDTCGATQGAKLSHSLIFVETVNPSCSKQGYDLYRCEHCSYTEKQNYTVAANHTYVTMDLPSAAAKAVNAGLLTYGKYASNSWCDYDTQICSGCNHIDIASTKFRYTQREAAQMMLNWVNELRAEVYGTHAYDLVLDDYCQSEAERRAVQLTTNYSHGGKKTSGENIANNLSLYAQFLAWKNSPGHYENMISRSFTRFGYGYAACGDNGFNAASGYGCQSFNP